MTAHVSADTRLNTDLKHPAVKIVQESTANRNLRVFLVLRKTVLFLAAIVATEQSAVTVKTTHAPVVPKTTARVGVCVYLVNLTVRVAETVTQAAELVSHRVALTLAVHSAKNVPRVTVTNVVTLTAARFAAAVPGIIVIAPDAESVKNPRRVSSAVMRHVVFVLVKQPVHALNVELLTVPFARRLVTEVRFALLVTDTDVHV